MLAVITRLDNNRLEIASRTGYRCQPSHLLDLYLAYPFCLQKYLL